MSSLASTVNAVIRDIYHLTRQVSLSLHKESALLRLKEIIPFDSAKWGVGRVSGAQVAIHGMHLHNLPQESMRAYHNIQRQDVLVRAINRHPGRAIRLSDLMSRDELHASALYRLYGARFGLEHAMSIAFVDDRTNLIEGIGLYRASVDAPFYEGEREIFEMVAPHLVESHSIVQFSELRRHTGATIRVGPAAVCDKLGMLYDAEPQFIDLLQQEWPSWQGSRVPKQLCKAIASGERHVVGDTVCFTIDAAHELFLIGAVSWDPFKVLSPRQRVIAVAVAEGATYKEVAHEFGISPSTVTKHMNAIYKRLGVTRNIHLAQLIRTY